MLVIKVLRKIKSITLAHKLKNTYRQKIEITTIKQNEISETKRSVLRYGNRGFSKNEYVPEIDKIIFLIETLLWQYIGFFNKRVLTKVTMERKVYSYRTNEAARLNWPCVRINLISCK